MTPFENHPNPKRLITRARLAYELGGVLLGLRVAWPVLPLSFFSWSCCGAQAIPVGLGILLFVLSVGLVSRGGLGISANGDEEIVGRFAWRAEHHGYELGHPDGARSLDVRDNALHALKARVAAPAPV